MVGYGGVSQYIPFILQVAYVLAMVTRPFLGLALLGRQRSPQSHRYLYPGDSLLAAFKQLRYFGYTRCQRMNSADNVGASDFPRKANRLLHCVRKLQ